MSHTSADTWNAAVCLVQAHGSAERAVTFLARPEAHDDTARAFLRCRYDLASAIDYLLANRDVLEADAGLRPMRRPDGGRIRPGRERVDNRCPRCGKGPTTCPHSEPS